MAADARIQTLLADSAQDFGPTQQHILALALALREQGIFEPHICCPAHAPLGGAAQKAGLPQITFAPEGGLASLLRLWWHQHHGRRLCIHSFSPSALMAGWRLAHLRSKGTTLRLHSCAAPPSLVKSQWPAWTSLDRALCADAVTQATLAALTEGRMGSGVLMVVHPALDTSPLPLCDPRRPHKDGRCVFAALGPLDDGGGMETLLEAMALLREEDHGPWEVRVAGQGPHFQALLDQARAQGTADFLALLGRQPVEAVLPLCDAVIVPSEKPQGQWDAVAAAWAMGLPLICSSAPTHMETVREDRSALIFPPGHAPELAAAMSRILQGPHLRRQLAEESRRMRPAVDMQRLTEECIAIYAACAQQKGWAHAAPPPSLNPQPTDEHHEM